MPQYSGHIWASIALAPTQNKKEKIFGAAPQSQYERHIHVAKEASSHKITRYTGTLFICSYPKRFSTRRFQSFILSSRLVPTSSFCAEGFSPTPKAFSFECCNDGGETEKIKKYSISNNCYGSSISHVRNNEHACIFN